MHHNPRFLDLADIFEKKLIFINPYIGILDDYALLDSSKTIGIEHLEAAIAVWNYCRDSALFLFAGRHEDSVIQTILKALESAPLTGTDLHSLFNNNLPAQRIKDALSELIASKRVISEKVKGEKGAPITTYKLNDEPYEINELNELNRDLDSSPSINSLNSLNSSNVLKKVDNNTLPDFMTGKFQ